MPAVGSYRATSQLQPALPAHLLRLLVKFHQWAGVYLRALLRAVFRLGLVHIGLCVLLRLDWTAQRRRYGGSAKRDRLRCQES